MQQFPLNQWEIFHFSVKRSGYSIGGLKIKKVIYISAER